MSPLRLLLVEDNPADALMVEVTLEEVVSFAPTLQLCERLGEAETALEAAIFDVVLLDLNLPDGQGLENFTRLERRAPDTPIIVLTGLADEKIALEAIQRGAADYLIKGKTDAPLLERSMRYAIERKKNEAGRIELARARAAREQAESANRAKDEFLATLSHELRTPLNAILGWACLLGEGQLEPAEQIQAISTIERNARVQAQLIEDLLDVSRIITGNLSLQSEDNNPAELTRAAIEGLRPTITKKSLALQLDLDEEICVQGDPTRLQQIFWNLVSNAVKFTPQNGQVTVSLRAQGENAIWSVRDSGIGIEPQFLPHVFERFRQADGSTTRRHGGLGLGLSIVATLTELHSGTIEAHSDGPHQGAIFTVRLPLCSRATPTPKVNLSRGALPDNVLAGLRILAVDDQNDARQMVRLALEGAGAQVAIADSANQALEVLREFRPHVLVCDVGMPEMDGYQLMRHLRRRPLWAELPALALTGYARSEEREMARAAGFQDFLSKPVSPPDLLRAVAALAQNP